MPLDLLYETIYSPPVDGLVFELMHESNHESERITDHHIHRTQVLIFLRMILLVRVRIDARQLVTRVYPTKQSSTLLAVVCFMGPIR